MEEIVIVCSDLGKVLHCGQRDFFKKGQGRTKEHYEQVYSQEGHQTNNKTLKHFMIHQIQLDSPDSKQCPVLEHVSPPPAPSGVIRTTILNIFDLEGVYEHCMKYLTY